MHTRPTAGQWLRYAFGGRLPASLHEWVRHDLTDADWRWREVLRVLVQCAVPVVVILLLPVDLELRVLMVALVVFGALFVAGAYGDELRDRRLRQHGLPPANPPD
ncbi:MAG: hypothetical protein V7637_4088 [Mycobacteriales bacterium]